MARVEAGLRARARRLQQYVDHRRRWRTRSGVCPPLGMGAHLAVRRGLRRAFGIDVHLVPPKGFVRITKQTMAFEVDPAFTGLVEQAIERSADESIGREGDAAVRHRNKLYNLLQLLGLTQGVDGLVVECGSYRGLTAYLLCRSLAGEDGGFSGKGVHLFDSFEGLSPLAPADRIEHAQAARGKTKRGAGMFAASEETVRKTLREFPDVHLHRGWIPQSLGDAPDGPFRFVHLDLDLHDPTAASLAYFHPRLSPGGVVVCDDDGSLRWPGVRTAVDEYCTQHGIRPLRLSTGQAVLFSR